MSFDQLPEMGLEVFTLRAWDDDWPTTQVGTISLVRKRFHIVGGADLGEQCIGCLIRRLQKGRFPGLKVFRANSDVRFQTYSLGKSDGSWSFGVGTAPFKAEFDRARVIRLMLPLAGPLHLGMDVAVSPVGADLIIAVGRWLAGAPLKPPGKTLPHNIDSLGIGPLGCISIPVMAFGALLLYIGISQGKTVPVAAWLWIAIPAVIIIGSIGTEWAHKQRYKSQVLDYSRGRQTLGEQGIWPFSEASDFGEAYSPFQEGRETRSAFFAAICSEITQTLADLEIPRERVVETTGTKP